MGTEIPNPGHGDTQPEIRRLLTAADYFLRRRFFEDCCKYAARAIDADPTSPSAARILAIASVLSVSMVSSSQRDYYAVLNLRNFESDAARIVAGFETLASILDPSANPYPFASEALDLVMKAWSVLSNPIEKARYDGELRRRVQGGGGGGGCTLGSGGGTFWTMCPYCYYVYEYDRAFEDCCLRCANERCRRVLHAAAIAAPPPPDVVAKGQYWCPGFMPFEIRDSNGDGTRMKLWNPLGVDGSHRNCVVVVSDDVFEGEGIQNNGHSNGGNTIEKASTKRRKPVSQNSYDLIGREARIDNNLGNCDSEEEHQDVDPTLDEVKIGVDFFEVDDEVFLSLPCDVDLENAGYDHDEFSYYFLNLFCSLNFLPFRSTY